MNDDLVDFFPVAEIIWLLFICLLILSTPGLEYD